MTSRPDPYGDLAQALRGVVEEAVTRALAAAADSGGGGDVVLLSIEKAAERLGLGVTKTKELIAAGAIQSRVVGRRRLVPVAALAAFGTAS